MNFQSSFFKKILGLGIILALGQNNAHAFDSSIKSLSNTLSTKFIATTQSNEDVLLGVGYDSLFEKHLETECLNFDPPKTTAGLGNLNFGLKLSQEDLIRKLENSYKASGKIKGFKFKGSARYLKETKNSALSLTSYFVLENNIGTKTISPSFNNLLSLNGKGALENGVWLKICGDNYVKKITYGGLLIVGLQYEFTSEYFKKEFEATAYGAYNDIFKADAAHKSLSENTKRNIKLSIVAHQIGGKTLDLARVLGDVNDDTGIYASEKCALADSATCNKLIAGIVSYATNQYPKDIDALPAAIEYELRSYADLGSLIPGQPKLPQDVISMREQLLNVLDIQLEKSSIIEKIKSIYEPRLSSETIYQMNSALDDLYDNINDIVQAADICYSYDVLSNGSPCTSNGARTLSLLRTVNETLLKTPAKIELLNYNRISQGWGSHKECRAPENHVITGFGAKTDNHSTVTSLPLEVREILPGGNLGPRVMICDGGSQAFVSVPDDYVLVSAGATGGKNKIRFVTAYARKYNPKTTSLEGPVIAWGYNNPQVDIGREGSLPLNNRVATGIGLYGYKSALKGIVIHSHEITTAKQ
jgi:hypothetical protein